MEDCVFKKIYEIKLKLKQRVTEKKTLRVDFLQKDNGNNQMVLVRSKNTSADKVPSWFGAAFSTANRT